jgi:hypothetical protein
LGRGYSQNAANQRGRWTRSSYIEYHGQTTQQLIFFYLSALIRRQGLSSPTQTSQCKSYKVVLNALRENSNIFKNIQHVVNVSYKKQRTKMPTLRHTRMYVCAFILNTLFRVSPLCYKIVHQ